MSFINSALSRINKLGSSSQKVEPELTEEALAELNEKRMQRMRKLSVFLFYVLGFGLSYQTAIFLWNLVPAVRVELPGLNKDELAQIQQPVQEKLLSSMHIFGEVGEIGAENNTPTVKGSTPGQVVRSKLNVKINGISAATDGRGAVTLVYNGKEETYGVGDKIGSATIKEIKPNSIIVDNVGRQEEIIFLEDDGPVSRYDDEKESNNDTSNDSKLTKQEIQNVRTELLSNPGNLLKYINIKPATRDGRVIGYELNPGSDSRLFINSGLKSGDIAVEINGKDLTNNAQAMQVMGELQNMTEVSIVIDRNGSRESINLDLK